MKKIILILFLFCLAGSSVWAEERLQSAYFGVAIGVMAVPENVDAGMGLALKGGVDLNNVLQNLGAEVELQKSIIDPEYGRSNDVNIVSLAAYATYDINIPSSKFAIRPRFGIILPNLGDKDSVNSRNYGFSSGLDVSFKVSDELKLYGGYTNLGENVNTYLAGIEIHF
ncbi:hypothetical protein KKG72_12405 [bacterium]|nr:hypothetical protein [bacterium]MBU1994976.1 hypothetical protein [bacterium]